MAINFLYIGYLQKFAYCEYPPQVVQKYQIVFRGKLQGEDGITMHELDILMCSYPDGPDKTNCVLNDSDLSRSFSALVTLQLRSCLRRR